MEDAEDKAEKAEAFWRRVFLRMLLAMRAAMIQETLVSISDLPSRRPDPTANDQEPKMITSRTELLLRTQLSRSKAIKYTFIEPENCRHTNLVGHGGKTFWWTCKACGSRWPRIPGEIIETEGKSA